MRHMLASACPSSPLFFKRRTRLLLMSRPDLNLMSPPATRPPSLRFIPATAPHNNFIKNMPVLLLSSFKRHRQSHAFARTNRMNLLEVIIALAAVVNFADGQQQLRERARACLSNDSTSRPKDTGGAHAFLLQLYFLCCLPLCLSNIYAAATNAFGHGPPDVRLKSVLVSSGGSSINRANFPVPRPRFMPQTRRSPPLPPLPSTPIILPCFCPPSQSPVQGLQSARVVIWTGSRTRSYSPPIVSIIITHPCQHHFPSRACLLLSSLMPTPVSNLNPHHRQDANQASLRAPGSPRPGLAARDHPDFCRPFPSVLASPGAPSRASPQG